jgi:hypothetical protein
LLNPNKIQRGHKEDGAVMSPVLTINENYQISFSKLSIPYTSTGILYIGEIRSVSVVMKKIPVRIRTLFGIRYRIMNHESVN